LHVIRGYKKCETEISFTLHSPLFFHSHLQKFHSPWGEPFSRLRIADVIDNKLKSTVFSTANSLNLRVNTNLQCTI